MPLLMLKWLSLGELTPTTMSLQMVERSMDKLEGILEDVLVKVGKFIFLVDFVVIDTEEDKKILLFLGRPFIETGAALIDVKKGELTLRVGTEEVHFNLSKSLKQHDVEQAQCIKIDSVNSVCKKLNDDLMNESSIDDYISSSLYDNDFEKEKIMTETVLNLNERNIDYLSSEQIVPVEEKSSEGLVLKELPKHLKYVFLEEEKSKPFIIAANLTIEKE